MANHVIIGKGNIGTDLYRELVSKGQTAHILSQSTGFKWPESKGVLTALNPEYIWLTAGAGSIEAAKKDFNKVLHTHVTMVVEMLMWLPKEVKVCLFSTDYVADENDSLNPHSHTAHPRSLYALTKMWMEDAVKCQKRANTSVIRVTSVYGAEFPERCFTGKILKNYPIPGDVSLPSNRVTPSASKWIAQVLVRNLNKMFLNEPTFHHCAPTGSVSLAAWGQKILGEDYRVVPSGYDQERPLATCLGCSLEQAPDWMEVWNSDWWSKPATDNHEAEL